MTTSDALTFVATVVSCVSILISWFALKATKKVYASDILRSQAEGEMELFTLWEGVSLVHKLAPVTPQVAKSHRALTATARRWISDPIQRNVLVENFRSDYIELYESFRDCVANVAGLGRPVNTLLTEDMHRVYAQMTALRDT